MIGHRSCPFRVFRRAVALVALLSMLTPIEPLLPDAHDGIAVAPALVDGSLTPPAGHHAFPSAPTPEHRTHVDHCSHGHLLTIESRERAPARCALPAGEGFDTSSPRLESVSVPPHERPPIA